MSTFPKVTYASALQFQPRINSTETLQSFFSTDGYPHLSEIFSFSPRFQSYWIESSASREKAQTMLELHHAIKEKKYEWFHNQFPLVTPLTLHKMEEGIGFLQTQPHFEKLLYLLIYTAEYKDLDDKRNILKELLNLEKMSEDVVKFQETYLRPFQMISGELSQKAMNRFLNGFSKDSKRPLLIVSSLLSFYQLDRAKVNAKNSEMICLITNPDRHGALLDSLLKDRVSNFCQAQNPITTPSFGEEVENIRKTKERVAEFERLRNDLDDRVGDKKITAFLKHVSLFGFAEAFSEMSIPSIIRLIHLSSLICCPNNRKSPTCDQVIISPQKWSKGLDEFLSDSTKTNDQIVDRLTYVENGALVWKSYEPSVWGQKV